MAQPKPKTVTIIGGSLAGLFAGVAIKRLSPNARIRIFERNPTPLLHDQGAGVVAGGDTQAFFAKYDRTKTPLTVTSKARLYLNRDGDVIDREQREQRMTSWDLLYHILRANFDGVESDYAKPPTEEAEELKRVSYEYGCTVTDIKTPSPATSHTDAVDFSKPVEVCVTQSSGESLTIPADFVIACDGSSSTIRSLYFPETRRTYAGYVAWRGTVPESSISSSAAEVFKEKFTFFHSEGVQILAYLIPGKNGTLKEGERLVNWVWYLNYKDGSEELENLMTDKEGKKHHVTLPPGGIRSSVWAQQKDTAKEILPPQFAELVQKTEVPFIQAITDVIAPKAIPDNGRVVMIGDALAGFRPHTAASTSQAAMDAMGLAEALKSILEDQTVGMKALREWEKGVTQYAKEMQRFGVNIGNRSQFGMHPLQS